MKGVIKYYCKQPKSAIAKDILIWIALAGVLSVATNSPYFARNLLRKWKYRKKYSLPYASTIFHRMRKTGLLVVERKSHRYNVSLTEKGKRQAGWVQLNTLEIKHTKTWNGLWFFLMFDIPQTERWKRDIFRSFLERLKFTLFQKSVWVHAYDPTPELEVLRKFLDISDKDVKIIAVQDNGLSKEDSLRLRKRFTLNS